MHRAIPTLTLLFLLIGAPALAQPGASEIIDRSLQAYSEMMGGVDSYLMTMEMMGMEHEMYFERIDGGGPLDFRPSVRMRGQTEWVRHDEEMPGGATLPTAEMFAQLRDQARFVGEQTVDGRRVYALVVDDPKDLFPADLPVEEHFELEEMTIYVAADDYQMIGFDSRGTAQDGGTQPVTMQMRMSDFRTVGTVQHPFLTTMRIEGMMSGLSDEERRQLEDARRQMEQLPPEQRQMMERMMGDQLKQLERMIAGEALEMEMRVIDLQVNVPRPE